MSLFCVFFCVCLAIEQISVWKFMKCASFILRLQGFPNTHCSCEINSAVCTRELWLLGFDPQASICAGNVPVKSLVKKQMNKLLVKELICVYRGKFLSVNIISLNPNICPTVEYKHFFFPSHSAWSYFLALCNIFLCRCTLALIQTNYLLEYLQQHDLVVLLFKRIFN